MVNIYVVVVTSGWNPDILLVTNDKEEALRRGKEYAGDWDNAEEGGTSYLKDDGTTVSVRSGNTLYFNQKGVGDMDESVSVFEVEQEALMEQLYHTLRDMISDKYAIEMRDKYYLGGAAVVVLPVKSTHPWTIFVWPTLEEALSHAIDKFRNPEKDYTEVDGTLWKADDESVYDEKHIRRFLKETVN